MRRIGRVGLLLAVLGLLPAASVPAARAAGEAIAPARIVMITWRGETDAERAFRDALNAGPRPVSIRMAHAGQNTAVLAAIIDHIQAAPPDLIYVFGTTATKAVLARIHDIPVVFNIVNRPVAAGVIASWKRSGNNATGVSNQVPMDDQLLALKKIIDFRRLGIVYNPNEQNSRIQVDIARRLEERFGFTVSGFPITGTADIPVILPGLQGQVDAVFFLGDSLIISLGAAIMERVNHYRLPSLAVVDSMVVDDGVLLGLTTDFSELGRMAAEKARRILDGEAPGDIPSAVMDYYRITVNMTTARTIGVQIPISLLVITNRIIRN